MGDPLVSVERFGGLSRRLFGSRQPANSPPRIHHGSHLPMGHHRRVAGYRERPAILGGPRPHGPLRSLPLTPTGSPISAHRQTIKRLRPQIFFFRCFSLGPRPLCGCYSILLNRSLNLDLHALAWAIRSVTHLVLACFVSWSFAPFSSTRCSRTTSYAQPRFTTGSRKSSVPSGVHSVRRALVRVWLIGLSRPTLCRLTVRSNRRKNILVRRWSPVVSGSHLQVCHWLSSNPLQCVLRDLRLARAACSSRLALISIYSSKADLLFLVLLSLLPLAAHRRDVVVGKQAPPISPLDLVQPLCWLTPALPKSLQPSVR